MNDTRPLVELDRVGFAYERTAPDAWILQDVTLQVDPLDFLAIIGPNGGGKTTLLKIMLGLLEPTRGTVKVFGQKPARVRHELGYVPQQAKIDETVPASVLEVVMTGRLSRSRWGFSFSAEDREAARTALTETGTADLADRPIGQLSGGQRQRVLISRALVCGAKLLLLDEPTTGVDAHMEKELIDLLHRLNERLPIVMISHDIAFVSAHFKRVACLNRRLSCHHAADVTGQTISSMYHGPLQRVSHDDNCVTSDGALPHETHVPHDHEHDHPSPQP